jgi:hypothetical protein
MVMMLPVVMRADCIPATVDREKADEPTALWW